MDSLPVLSPFELEGTWDALLPDPVNEHRSGLRSSVHFEHGNEAPLAVELDILFKLTLAMFPIDSYPTRRSACPAGAHWRTLPSAVWIMNWVLKLESPQ